MNLRDWLKKHWKKPSFGFFLKPAVGAFIISTLVSSGISIWEIRYTDVLNQRAQQNEDLQNQRAQQKEDLLNERDKQEENFRNNAMLFNSAVADYVQDIIRNNQATTASSDQLVTAIMSEYNEVDDVSPYLPAEDKHLVVDYKASLVEMREVLSTSNSIATLKPFWEQTNKILLLRKEIDLALPG
jgi:hypothetical protein